MNSCVLIVKRTITAHLCMLRASHLSSGESGLFALQVDAGEKLIEQGDDGDNFYVIER